jgi:hypothetical protein
MSHPIAFHAKMMGDIMYLNQALQQPDADQFVEAVIAEVNGHVDNKHWQLPKRSEVPTDTDVLPSVWPMHCKRDITTNEIKKYKACLNLHGGKQEFGTNYYIRTCRDLVLDPPADCHWHHFWMGSLPV